MKYFSKKVEKSAFQGYIPLSLIPTGGHYIRERGIPERINRTSLGAMMARDPCATSSCCFRGVPLRHRKVGSDQRGLGRKTWGGRSPRGNGQDVPPSNGDAAYTRPPGTNEKSCAAYAHMRDEKSQKGKKSLLKTVTSTQKYQKSLLKTPTSTQKRLPHSEKSQAAHKKGFTI